MFVVVELFIPEIVDEHGKHPVSTELDDACLVPLQACKFLKLKHQIILLYIRMIKAGIEITM